MVQHSDIDHTGITGVGGSAPTLGAASVTRTTGNVATTSTSLVDVTGLTVSSVVTTGGPVMIVFEADIDNSEATSQTWFDFKRDNTTLLGGGTRGLASFRASVNGDLTHISVVYFDPVGAGTYAWKVQMASSSGSGTATVYADGTNRSARFYVREMPVKGITS